MEPLLEFKEVSFSYHTLQAETLAVDHMSFRMYPGEFMVIVGPSGCGKSTILSLICGLLQPDSGSVLVSGQSARKSNTTIGYMFQKDHLFEWRRIMDNVSLGLEIQKNLTPDTKAQVATMLKNYGLGDFQNSPPSSLSGGMRQRAALVRTLALQPDLLLLDEPFSALDYQTRLEVGDDIATIIRRSGKAALMVTHDLAEAVSIGDRVLVLSRRPAAIRADISIAQGMEEQSPMERRSNPKFYEYFNQIWEEIQNEKTIPG